MYWTCKSCEAKNPENARVCGKCGEKTATPPKFYTTWIFGGAVVFFIVYIVGAFFGGTMVAFSIEPTDDAVFAAAKAQGVEAKKLLDVSPDERKKARKAAIAKARSQMSLLVHSLLFWFLPFFAFPVCGVMVGYVSQGRTVIEAALASVVGQVVGFLFVRFMSGVSIHWIELIIGLVVGFVFAGAGAYIGEAVQEKRERENLELEIEY